MQTFIRRTAIVAALALLAPVYGCSDDNPTAATVAPSDALYDGGATFGSGSRSGTASTENTTAADSGSAARGGATFGSGS